MTIYCPSSMASYNDGSKAMKVACKDCHFIKNESAEIKRIIDKLRNR